MPKPVLSDSLFNSDDVATAILENANLQVTNSAFAITDFSDDIVLDSAFEHQTTSLNNPPYVAIHFNSIVFMYGALRCSSSDAIDGATVLTVPSAYYPHRLVACNTSSLDEDTARRIQINTSGVMSIVDPVNSGSGTFHMVFNFWYKI